MDKFKKYGLWLITGLATLAFLAAGGAKVAGVPDMHASFAAMGLPGWFGYFIGLCEIAGAIGLWLPRLRTWAGAGLVVIMLGAVYFHIAYSVPSPIPAIILGAISATVAIVYRKEAMFLAKSSA